MFRELTSAVVHLVIVGLSAGAVAVFVAVLRTAPHRGCAGAGGANKTLLASLVLIKRCRKIRQVFGIVGAAHFADRVHGQQADPGVDGFDPQPGCRDRADGRSGGLGVLGDKHLVGYTGLFGPASKLRRTLPIGQVPLGRVHLQDWPMVGQRLVLRVVTFRVVRVDQVTAVSREQHGV